MTKHLKLMILVTWKEQGQWDLYQTLKDLVARLEILQPFFFEQPQPAFLQKFANRLSSFYIPIMALKKGKGFDAIFSWSMRMGVCFGILKHFLGTTSGPKHILRDFHINLVRKDLAYRIKLRLMKLAFPGIDYFLCTSNAEVTIYTKMFGIPSDRICFYPDSPSDHLFKNFAVLKKDYIFAYGNSDRDFKTLIRACKEPLCQVIILSQKYIPSLPLPNHIKMIKDMVSEEKLIDLILSSRLVVLPLNDYAISAGQNTMIETMALGRPLIVTSNMATIEYATHGDTALFFQAQDVKGLQKQIRFLVQNPEIAEKMGYRAREAIRAFPDKEMAVLFNVIEQVCR